LDFFLVAADDPRGVTGEEERVEEDIEREGAAIGAVEEAGEEDSEEEELEGVRGLDPIGVDEEAEVVDDSVVMDSGPAMRLC